MTTIMEVKNGIDEEKDLEMQGENCDVIEEVDDEDKDTATYEE